MSDNDNKVKKRSESIIKLFNAAIGKQIGEIPGPIPPFSKWLNGRMVSANKGEIELEFEIREEMANPTGLLHGGLQGAIIDDTIGMTTATLGYEGFLISIDSQLNYLGKVKVGEKVRAKSKLIREGRNIVNIYCEILDKDGKLVTTGSSNLLKTHYTPDYIKAIDNTIDEEN